VLYDDQTDEWMRPTRFKVSGGKEQTVVVITENEVYIRDEASGRLVPDPNQGVDPAALGGGEAAAASGGAAAGGSAGAGAGTAGQLAAAKPAAAQQQLAQQAQQAQQQAPVRSTTSRSSEGRRPHAARAPGDIPPRCRWPRKKRQKK
jgi:membrane protease subunit (stomatin/prohibitin family)